MLKKFHKNTRKYKIHDIICVDEKFLNFLITCQSGRLTIKAMNQEV